MLNSNDPNQVNSVYLHQSPLKLQQKKEEDEFSLSLKKAYESHNEKDLETILFQSSKNQTPTFEKFLVMKSELS